MESDRLARIRNAEEQAHRKVYMTETLYESDTWLRKPIRTVLDILPYFEGRQKLRVLDLGCGIGRNCIPVAQKFYASGCRIDCVDILDIAIGQLYYYSEKYGVRSCINGIVMPIERYEISQGKYDLILAVSALEHVEDSAVFHVMLEKIRAGIRPGGIVCLVINSNIAETEKESGRECAVQFEVNLPTEELVRQLTEAFSGWEIIKHTIVKQQYDIPRDTTITLTTDVVTWVARYC